MEWFLHGEDEGIKESFTGRLKCDAVNLQVRLRFSGIPFETYSVKCVRDVHAGDSLYQTKWRPELLRVFRVLCGSV